MLKYERAAANGRDKKHHVFSCMGGNRCSDSQSTAGRDGSVHDFFGRQWQGESKQFRCVGIRLL